MAHCVFERLLFIESAQSLRADCTPWAANRLSVQWRAIALPLLHDSLPLPDSGQ